MIGFSKHIQETVPLAAGLLCLGLAGLIWMPINQTPSFEEPAEAARAAEANAEADAQLSKGALELLNRPLFHITRRPPEIAAAPTPVPVVVTLSLTGVINSDNVQVALLRLSNRPELFRARVGESVGNWEVTDITQTSVTVVTPDGDEQVISLSAGN
ncbi:MAG: hypothetical protein AAFU41_10010 [Pseudomonadota bacterium]